MIIDVWLAGPKMANFADREVMDFVSPDLTGDVPSRGKHAAIKTACERWWNLALGTLDFYTVTQTSRSDSGVYEVLILPPGRDVDYGEQLISPRKIGL